MSNKMRMDQVMSAFLEASSRTKQSIDKLIIEVRDPRM